MKYAGIILSAVVMFIVSFNQPTLSATKSNKDTNDKEAASESSQLASPEARALYDFIKIDNDFSAFFSTNPMFVSKEDTRVARGLYTADIVYNINHTEFISMNYDVRKTDSLISPFAGYIDVEYNEKRNGSCGDVYMRDSKIGAIGYSNIDAALRKASDGSCFKILMSRIVRYEFAYQNGKWVLKNIRDIRNNKLRNKDSMSAVFGIKEDTFKFITEPSGLDFNKKWLNFIKPFKN